MEERFKPADAKGGRGGEGWRARLVRLARYSWLRILRLKATPHQIALGLAVGVFSGCLPTMPGPPIQSIAAVALAFVLRCSKVAALLATWISNPLNWVFFYYIDFKLGKLFFPFVELNFDPTTMTMAELLDTGWRGVLIMFVGGAVLGVPSALLTYVVALPLVRSYRKRRTLRLLHRKGTLQK